MSLFQAREWWAKRPDTAQTVSSNAFVVANIDNDVTGTMKICTGSLEGILRIYAPRQRDFQVDDVFLEQQLDHPILQLSAGRFISNSSSLALAVLHPRALVVYMVISEGEKGAPTFMRLSCAYTHVLGEQDGTHFSAYNMCHGAFGSANIQSTGDFICVQSMDCQLSFFEQDKFAFSRQLPVDECLLPGPIAYVATTDSIVVATSDLRLVAYKYQLLAAATAAHPRHTSHRESKDDSKKSETKTSEVRTALGDGGRTLSPDWSVLLGEIILELHVGRYSRSLAASQLDIVVITDTSLFVLGDRGAVGQAIRQNNTTSGTDTKSTANASGTGTPRTSQTHYYSPIRMQKRLIYHPMACCLFPRDMTSIPEPNIADSVVDSPHNALVVTDTSMLEVYRGNALVWAAKTPCQPIAARVATLGGLHGLVVLLEADGTIRVTYMGTDPPSQVVGAFSSSSRRLDFDDMDREHRALLKKIRDAQSSQRLEPKDRLSLQATVPSLCEYVHIDADNLPIEIELNEFGNRNRSKLMDGLQTVATVKVALTLSYSGIDSIEKITVALQIPSCIHTDTATYTIPYMNGRHQNATAAPSTHTINLIFRALPRGIPSDLTIRAAASYFTTSSEPRTSTCSFTLPFSMACRVTPPVKSATYKLTIDTDQGPPNHLATDLFRDMLAQAELQADELQRIESTGANVLSFRYYSGADASVLVSKSAGRYRIQSGSLEALYLITQQLVVRLQKYFDSLSKKVKITFDEPLPLADFFECVEAHLGARLGLEKIKSDLNDRAAQFRTVEKRLLLRFRDRNPAPLSHLDTLLTGTHKNLVELADQAISIFDTLAASQNRLECSVRLMHILMRLRFKLDEQETDVLEKYLSAYVEDNNEQGWEERVNASITYLLKTVLSKSAHPNEDEGSLTTTNLKIPPDTHSLRKCIAMLCDRLDKGGSLLGK